MNLESSLRALIKRPKSMIGADGRSHPALHYTTELQSAIKWLKDRYEDGTLKVEGYDCEQEATRKKLERHSFRRTDGYDLKGYMIRSEFMRETGFGHRTVDRISQEAGARLKIGAHVYININKFFYYLDNLEHINDENIVLNLTMATKMLRLEQRDVKRLIKEGKIKADKTALQSRVYRIYKSSIIEYLNSVKGEEDGEISSNDSEVH